MPLAAAWIISKLALADPLPSKAEISLISNSCSDTHWAYGMGGGKLGGGEDGGGAEGGGGRLGGGGDGGGNGGRDGRGGRRDSNNGTVGGGKGGGGDGGGARPARTCTWEADVTVNPTASANLSFVSVLTKASSSAACAPAGTRSSIRIQTDAG
eukprot:scaffold5281_cov211-Isochrysis_galbana.AAC.2